MRILVLGAFQAELANIIQMFPDIKQRTISKRRCMLAQMGTTELVFSTSGIGATAAACTTTALCEGYEPDYIILCGVAGGLEKNQQVGDLILAESIVDADLYALRGLLTGTPYAPCLTDPHTQTPIKNEYITNSSLLRIGSSLSLDRFKTGIIASSNVFPAPKELFAQIIKLGCSAIEMESSGVIKAAEHYNVPVITVRAISNLINSSGDDLGTASHALAICSQRIALFLSFFLQKIKVLEPRARANQSKNIFYIINKYDLSKHPEGGWYRRTFNSEDLIILKGDESTRYNGEARSAGTSIIYLLAHGDFSAWHTVNSDETWNYHGGDPLLLRIINPKNGELNLIVLSSEDTLQFTVKAGYIFSAESSGKYTLNGCVVTPGFNFKDFKLIDPVEFIERFPQHINLVRLAREKIVVDAITPNFFKSNEISIETNSVSPIRSKL